MNGSGSNTSAAALKTLFFALALASCSAEPSLSAASPSRSRSIRWPQGFSPDDADIFAHNEIAIRGGCERPWALLVDAPHWPDWYPNSRDVTLAGTNETTLRTGTRFHWTTFGFAVESQVVELEAPRRLTWSGRTEGMAAYHAWLLTPIENGCQVITQEVAKGRSALELERTKPEAMQGGHALWLAKLKESSER